MHNRWLTFETIISLHCRALKMRLTIAFYVIYMIRVHLLRARWRVFTQTMNSIPQMVRWTNCSWCLNWLFHLVHLISDEQCSVILFSINQSLTYMNSDSYDHLTTIWRYRFWLWLILFIVSYDLSTCEIEQSISDRLFVCLIHSSFWSFDLSFLMSTPYTIV